LSIVTDERSLVRSRTFRVEVKVPLSGLAMPGLDYRGLQTRRSLKQLKHVGGISTVSFMMKALVDVCKDSR
jgi:hypothetical protein